MSAIKNFIDIIPTSDYLADNLSIPVTTEYNIFEYMDEFDSLVIVLDSGITIVYEEEVKNPFIFDNIDEMYKYFAKIAGFDSIESTIKLFQNPLVISKIKHLFANKGLSVNKIFMIAYQFFMPSSYCCFDE